ncbi:MAG TPA: hypothetical protein VNG33_19880, partial [Polyangiaceae bacterium]|nr:hypothetical protein [Polyangiaceae bacterium]
MSARQASKNRRAEIVSVTEEWKHWKKQEEIRLLRNLDRGTLRRQRPAIPVEAIEILDRSCPR